MSGTVRLGLTRRARSDQKLIFPSNFCVLKISGKYPKCTGKYRKFLHILVNNFSVVQNWEPGIVPLSSARRDEANDTTFGQVLWKNFCDLPPRTDFLELGHEWYRSTRPDEERTFRSRNNFSDQLLCTENFGHVSGMYRIMYRKNVQWKISTTEFWSGSGTVELSLLSRSEWYQIFRGNFYFGLWVTTFGWWVWWDKLRFVVCLHCFHVFAGSVGWNAADHLAVLVC